MRAASRSRITATSTCSAARAACSSSATIPSATCGRTTSRRCDRRSPRAPGEGPVCDGSDVTQPDGAGPAVHEAEVAVRDVPERHRYELTVGDQVAGISIYRLGDGVMTFEHTEVDAAFEGRGLGSRLAKFALDDVRARGLRIRIECP